MNEYINELSFKNVKEFQLSLYQTLALLQFNEKDQVNYEEISESTKIGRSLQVLISFILKILTQFFFFFLKMKMT